MDLEAKRNKVAIYLKQYADLRSREDEGNPFSLPQPYELAKQKGVLMRTEDHEATHRTDMSDSEMQAHQRWQAEIQYQDEMAEKISANTDELKARAAGIHDVLSPQALESQVDKLDSLDSAVDKASGELETSTKRLKRVLIKIRTGDKCCITLVLLLLLIGLATVAINMISS